MLSSGDFLDLEGPTGMAEPWEPQECFFERLGLNERRRSHRRIFRQMLRDAVIGRTIVLHSDAAFESKFAECEMPEDVVVPDQVLYDAMRGIYDGAPSRSKAIYDLATDHDGYCWVLRWTLRWALQTQCETCLDGPPRVAWSPVASSGVGNTGRVDSASPGDRVWSTHKRKHPEDTPPDSPTDVIKRRKIATKDRSLLLTSKTLRSSLKKPPATASHDSRSDWIKSEADLYFPGSDPRTPMSLSSLLNPSAKASE